MRKILEVKYTRATVDKPWVVSEIDSQPANLPVDEFEAAMRSEGWQVGEVWPLTILPADTLVWPRTWCREVAES